MKNPAAARRRFLPATTRDEETFVGRLLRQETVGGAVVLVAALVAIVWANSPWAESYEAMRVFQVGPLDLEHWAADGALTLFFFLAGLELKREFLVGSLRKPTDALVPIVAAVCGVLVPAGVFAVLNLGWFGARSDLGGWAIPAATDIAFALAVLAVVGSALPTQLRAFLLTLAVVDDLIVILIIAVFYTESISLTPLLLAVVLLGVFVALQRIRGESWIFYVPLALSIWWLTHESGIHATVAGVAMGLVTRVLPDDNEDHSPAEALEHRLMPISAGVAVPFFALMSAGVAVSGGGDLLTHPVAIGVFVGLVLGKPLGVLGGAWIVTKLTRAELGADLSWRDISGVAALAGVGFTIALLVADLSYSDETREAAKVAVLVGSTVSAGVAAVILRRRSRTHVRAARSEPDSKD